MTRIHSTLRWDRCRRGRNGAGDVLLPVDDPVAGEDQQEEHEVGIAEDDEKIAERARDGGGGLVGGALWFAEEKQDEKEHRENAERGDAEDGFEAEMFVGPCRRRRVRRRRRC